MIIITDRYRCQVILSKPHLNLNLIQAKAKSFMARDNVHNFIIWCRLLGIYDCLLFETDDLVLRKNDKSFILCLLEVARRGAAFGMPAPMLVQFEQEIDREMALDDSSSNQEEEEEEGTKKEVKSKEEEEDDDATAGLVEYGPQPQIVTNDLRSLDEMVITPPTVFHLHSFIPSFVMAVGRAVGGN